MILLLTLDAIGILQAVIEVPTRKVPSCGAAVVKQDMHALRLRWLRFQEMTTYDPALFTGGFSRLAKRLCYLSRHLDVLIDFLSLLHR
jgi:hypothetical protein